MWRYLQELPINTLDGLGLRSRHLTNILGEPISGSARWHVLHSWEEMNNVRNEEDALIVRKIGIGGALRLLLEKLKKLKDLAERKAEKSGISYKDYVKQQEQEEQSEGVKTLKKEADQILFIIVYKSYLANKNAPEYIKAFRREIMEKFALIGEFASNNLYSNTETMINYGYPFYNLGWKIRNVKNFIVHRPWLERGYNSAKDKQNMNNFFSSDLAADKGMPGHPGLTHLRKNIEEFLGGKRRKTRRKSRKTKRRKPKRGHRGKSPKRKTKKRRRRRRK